jgi:hypothetical protein
MFESELGFPSRSNVALKVGDRPEVFWKEKAFWRMKTMGGRIQASYNQKKLKFLPDENKEEEDAEAHSTR